MNAPEPLKFPIHRKPYRLWRQAGDIGFYSIKPGATALAIWHVADNSDQAGFWPMVATADGWEALTTETLPTFELARDIICGYCARHGLEETA